nr:putative reverse transcriptase domain-containing protein [Tanacetum cinerariifolium]
MAPKQTTRSTPVITTPTTSVTNAQLQAMIDQGVTAALAARNANRNGDDSYTSGMCRPVQVARECTYPDFLKCQPLNFKGTEGVVGLSQWFKKMESVYSISNYTVACQVKFATCTLQGNALTWWNSHVKTTTPEAAHAMPWRTLKKMMTDKYYPKGEIKKLESEMSFVSTAFSSRIVITPNALDHYYNVELADERIVGLNTIIRGCTINFLNHPFNIDLIPVELGSFDVIIGMDWLAKYHVVIICAEKIDRIPFGDKILIVRGDGSSNKHETRLNIISYTKAQEYLTKRCHVFLENITAAKDEDKSKGKRLEDLPVVQEFLEVFPDRVYH